MANKREIGNDATLFAGGESYPVTSVSYTEDNDVSSVHFNDGKNPTHAVTTTEYSGSFEHSGGNEEFRDALFKQEEGHNGTISVAREDITIRVKGDENNYNFFGCIVESRDKDFPADDRTEVSYDFVAERLVVN